MRQIQRYVSYAALAGALILGIVVTTHAGTFF